MRQYETFDEEFGQQLEKILKELQNIDKVDIDKLEENNMLEQTIYMVVKETMGLFDTTAITAVQFTTSEKSAHRIIKEMAYGLTFEHYFDDTGFSVTHGKGLTIVDRGDETHTFKIHELKLDPGAQFAIKSSLNNVMQPQTIEEEYLESTEED